MKLIHSEMKRLYDPQLFVGLFDYRKGHLDIAGSGPNVQKWCRALFVEVTSSAKRHVNWLMMGPSRPTEATPDGRPVNDREWLINRWKNVATAKSWDSIRCDPTEIKRVLKAQKKSYAREAKTQFLSVDDDPDTYIPSDAE
ncbi:hypothetical protein C8A03DRAFT_39084 [Achaetomium macrosporum]|uniref:Uncharacterized protein n=1 Tax=Achaetomium macrosporum TaxID=79813 RepID=A0AAN7H9S6_9PEZI|nr:hypothetical protein C8A03DRAFT_39084 [Achaetomium macrosporum]